ncbi:transcription factor ETV7 isoform X2 [Vanacampus margaritifer]
MSMSLLVKEEQRKRSSPTLMHETKISGHHSPVSPDKIPNISPPTQDDLWHLPGQLRINPYLWNRDDVSLWLHWAHKEYSLRRPEKARFEMNGRALCLLTKEDFKHRCPSSGDVLYEILQYVIKQRRSVVPQNRSHIQRTVRPQMAVPKTEESLKPSSDNTQDEIVTLKEEPLNLTYREKPQRQIHRPDGRLPECRRLWEYVYKMLCDDQYQEYIRWEDRDSRVFRVVDPNGLAGLWGHHKNRDNMTYEKMSRALRHYYKLNIIKKERGHKFLFRFLKTPQDIGKELHDSFECPVHSPLQDGNFPDSSPSSELSEERFEVSPYRTSPECSPTEQPPPVR